MYDSDSDEEKGPEIARPSDPTKAKSDLDKTSPWILSKLEWQKSEIKRLKNEIDRKDKELQIQTTIEIRLQKEVENLKDKIVTLMALAGPEAVLSLKKAEASKVKYELKINKPEEKKKKQFLFLVQLLKIEIEIKRKILLLLEGKNKDLKKLMKMLVKVKLLILILSQIISLYLQRQNKY